MLILVLLFHSIALKLDLSTSLTTSQVINYKQIQYSSYISIGSPSQTFKVLIDTGSYIFWIHSSSSECQKCSKFDESQSKSFESKNLESSLTYLRGSVEGRLCKDLIRFAEKTSNNTEFLLADQVNDLDYIHADGILGLGYNGDQNLKYSLIFNLFQEFQIESPIFAINFNNFDEKSYLLIGEYEKEKFGVGKKVKVFQDFYSWSGRLEKVTFGDLHLVDYNTVYFDTGMSFFTGPQEQVLAIFDYLEGILSNCVLENYLTCSCSYKEIDFLPVLKFFIESHEFHILPKNYVIINRGSCIFLLVPSGSQNWGAGMGFFREYYSVFNYSDPSITFFSKRSVKSSLSQETSENPKAFTFPLLLAATSFVVFLFFARKSEIARGDYFKIPSYD